MGATLPEQRFVEVADGIVAVVHGDGSMGVANAAVVQDGTHALVVDTMLLPEMARQMIAEIGRRGARVDAVLNTHHHLDHVGGNAAFTGVPIASHPKAAGLITAMSDEVHLLAPRFPRFAERLAGLQLRAPDLGLDRVDLPLGGQFLSFADAHAPMDVAVWLPGQRVLLAGDLCSCEVVPLTIHGRLSGWIAALDALVSLRPAVVIPGHGRPGTTDDLVVLRGHLAAVLDGARRVEQCWVPEDVVLAELASSEIEGWIERDRVVLNLERARQEVREG